MKTMTNVKLEVIKKTLNKASQHYLNVMLIHKHMLSVIILAFFCVTLSAQSFENINGLGKKESEIIKMIDPICFNKGTYYTNGNRIDYYHSNETGLIGYVFDKKNICIQMVLPTKSQRSYNLTGYNALKLDSCNMTIITR